MSEKKNENVNLQIKNLTEHQHLFLRPSLLIGANDRDQKSSIMLMLHPTKNAGIYERSFYIYPLMKIIDEAITNSIDNALRNQKPNQTYIKISIINDPTSKKYGVITIENDGAGIPIILNKEFNKYSVELAFSQERSGSNFDESKEIKSNFTAAVFFSGSESYTPSTRVPFKITSALISTPRKTAAVSVV